MTQILNTIPTAKSQTSIIAATLGGVSLVPLIANPYFLIVAVVEGPLSSHVGINL